MRFVKSHFKGRWTGAVLNCDKRKYNGKRIGDLLTIVILYDRRGQRMQRRQVVRLDASWTADVVGIDTSWVNPDWFTYEPRT